MKTRSNSQQMGLRPHIHSMAMALGFLFCLTSVSQANEMHTLTSVDGRTIAVRIVSKSPGHVQVIRTADSQRFSIPLANLSEADRRFLATWEPPSSGWRPSSVGLRPCSFTEPPRRYHLSDTRRKSGNGGYAVVTTTNRCTGRVVSRQVVRTGGGGCRR